MAHPKFGTRVVTVSSAAVLLVVCGGLPACSRDVQAVTPQQLEQQYGIANAYTGQVTTSDGSLRGTLVPVTLPDGRRVELLIPNRRSAEPHSAYLRDDQGLHPVELQSNVTRDQLASSTPVVVSRRAESAHPRHRSWEKELLIIGGSAGAGAAVGAVTGGKKGAGIGAGAGGVGGLIYDLATRKNP